MMDEAPAGIGHNNPPVDDKWLAKAADKIRKIGVALADNKGLENAAAKTRQRWMDYGAILAEAREVISSNRKFNEWLKENDLEQYADRNTRTDAMWLSQLDPDFVDTFPAEISNPRAARHWYRKTLARLVETTEGQAEGASVAALPENDQAFINNIDAGDWDTAVAAWRKRIAVVRYEDMTVAGALDVILRKICKYSEPGKLADALVEAIQNGGLAEMLEGDTPARDDTPADDFGDEEQEAQEAQEDEEVY